MGWVGGWAGRDGRLGKVSGGLVGRLGRLGRLWSGVGAESFGTSGIFGLVETCTSDGSGSVGFGIDKSMLFSGLTVSAIIVRWLNGF
ncbi:hypothetical protein HK096_003288, partial [Nowakowskiella sp. JEL0078]